MGQCGFLHPLSLFLSFLPIPVLTAASVFPCHWTVTPRSPPALNIGQSEILNRAKASFLSGSIILLQRHLLQKSWRVLQNTETRPPLQTCPLKLEAKNNMAWPSLGAPNGAIAHCSIENHPGLLQIARGKVCRPGMMSENVHRKSWEPRRGCKVSASNSVAWAISSVRASWGRLFIPVPVDEALGRSLYCIWTNGHLKHYFSFNYEYAQQTTVAMNRTKHYCVPKKQNHSYF